jgi:predicted DNA repair protein MutK
MFAHSPRLFSPAIFYRILLHVQHSLGGLRSLIKKEDILAGSSLLTLLDDIATLLDDISVMGKLAAKKTAGVLGDDLSLNAQQVTGVRANRELPVVWGVARGSLLNKVILVPLALLISAFIPWAITPLLMLGGAYLCFEGVEKVLHTFEARKHKESPEARQKRLEALAAQNPQQFEKDKIKGAVRTDFILSAEIVAITLGIVADAPLLNQVLILSGIALLVTIGVYGLVGIIVKLDDMGYWLVEKRGVLAQGLGKGLLFVAPWLMKILSVVGTLAMFLVGGGIVVHGIPALHHAIEHFASTQNALVQAVVPMAANLVIGFAIGAVVIAVVNGINRLRGAK